MSKTMIDFIKTIVLGFGVIVVGCVFAFGLLLCFVDFMLGFDSGYPLLFRTIEIISVIIMSFSAGKCLIGGLK